MHIEIVKAFFLHHLIVPTILFVLVFPIGFLHKKLQLIKGKKLISYVLVSGIVFALPGLFGFTGNAFNPYWYIIASMVYLLFGWIHMNQILKRFQGQDASPVLSRLFELVVTGFILLLGVYLFTYIFDWLSPFTGYALVSATCSTSFLIPLLFYYSYIQFLKIPLSIYKTWSYDKNAQIIDFEDFNLKKLKIVTIELTKNTGDGSHFRIKAKTLATGVSFGDWFQKVLEDYNFKNNANSIELYQDDATYYTWVFYVKRSLFHFRKYIDFDLDFTQNKIKESDVIICKRVIEHK